MQTTKSPVNAGARNLHDSTDKLGREIGGIVNDATDLMKDYGAQQFDSARRSERAHV